MNGTSATRIRGWLMPKALCLIGLVVAGLVFLLFLLDIAIGLFDKASIIMDIMFMVGALGLAYLSWVSFREQK
ncbi:MAG: hypothetical protein U0905_22995 [Pirellulales bacterium]